MNGIYSIYNEEKAKFYVGSSNDIERRLIEHGNRILGRGRKGSIDCARIFSEVPFREIDVRLLSVCRPEELDSCEAYWMRLRNTNGELIFQNKTLYLNYPLPADIDSIIAASIVKYLPFKLYLLYEFTLESLLTPF